jgi:hypothetical protein
MFVYLAAEEPQPDDLLLILFYDVCQAAHAPALAFVALRSNFISSAFLSTSAFTSSPG